MTKTFTHNMIWANDQLNIRKKFIQDKWNDLSTNAIIEGFKPFIFEHSDITKSSTSISVSAYKRSPWFVRLLYSFSHHRGNSFPLWWRRWTN